MSFMVNKDEWDSLSDEDKEYIQKWRIENYPNMQTHAEIIDLPSGKEFKCLCDGRGCLRKKHQKKGGQR